MKNKKNIRKNKELVRKFFCKEIIRKFFCNEIFLRKLILRKFLNENIRKN